MAEYGKVQFQEGSAGEPAVDTAMQEAQAEAAAEAQETQQEGLEIQSSHENVIEKFGGDVEKMAQAYSELEKKLGAAPDPVESNPADLGQIQPYIDEWAQSGELSADSRKALESQFPSELIDDYLNSKAQAAQFQEAQAATELKSIYNSVGGEQNYGEIVQWAGENLSDEQIVAFNEAVNTGSFAQAELAVKGLAAQYQQASGSQPQLLQSTPDGNAGAGVYESMAQLMVDMKKPEYKTDPAFRQVVQARLSRSNVM
jgi:hypothetical protein